MKRYFQSSKISLARLSSALSEIFYLLIIFLVPLWFAFIFPTFNMFELNKLLLFRILLSVLSISVFIYLTSSGVYKKIIAGIHKGLGRSIIRLFWAPLILIIALSILLPLSLNSAQSFWGSYTRQQGLLSYLSYFWWAFLLFIYLIAQLIDKGKKVYNLKVKRILGTIVGTATLVSIYGILQILNIDIFTWPEPPYLTGRTLSTFGQPNFLGSFLLFIIPLCTYLLTRSKKRTTKFIYLLALTSQLLCLYFTGSRGATLALIAVLGIFIFSKTFFAKIGLKKKIVMGVSMLLFSLLSLLALNILIPGRMSSAFDMQTGSSAARVNFFQAASSAILDNPLLGYGLESGSDVFISYYERDWALHGPVSSSADRAHNLILDALVTTGFVGLLLFSLWYYAYFKMAFSLNKEDKNHKLSLALAFGALAYTLSLLFSFTIIVGEIYFWLFFAILASLVVVGGKKGDEFQLEDAKVFTTSKLKIIWSLLGLLLVIISTLSVYNSYQTLKSDYYLSQIEIAINRQDYVRALGLGQSIEDVAANPVLVEKAWRYTGTRLSEYCSYSSFADISEEVIIKADLLSIASRLKDNSYSNILLKAKIYSCLSKTDLANNYYQQMATLSPAWPTTYLEWGRHYTKADNIPKAIKYFKLVEVNLPDTSSPFINDKHRQSVYSYKHTMYRSLAETYMRANDYTSAEKFFQLAYRNLPADHSLLKKIADCHYLRGDKRLALRYNLHGLDLNPEDYNWSLVVAILYSELNDADQAARYLKKAIDLAPENKLDELNLIAKTL